MVFGVTYIVCEGLEPRCLEVSKCRVRYLSNMVLFVKKCLLEVRFIYIMTFSVVHWDT